MENSKLNNLVSASWLNKNNNNDLILLEASIKPVTASLESSFNNEIIPNSRKFDLRKVFSDLSSPYDHTLPSINQMVENIQKLGINNDSNIVVYDNKGIYSSPRVFFMLKSLGFDNVFILDGGLIAWKKEGYSLVNYYITLNTIGTFFVNNTINGYGFFCNSEYVFNRSIDSILIDVRSSGRFYGREKEPRDNLKSGHIPNSINILFEKFLDNGKLKSEEKLKSIFLNIDISKELIFSCGSGITYCIGALGVLSVGAQRIKIYDGSWGEWANIDNSFPIEL